MAWFEPNGLLRLCSVDFPYDGWEYKFSSRSAQTAFFEGNAVVSFDDMSYMQHDGSITVDVSPETVKDCNFIMFQNPTQEGIWWYARIIDWKWINPAVTCEIFYSIDWYQSYQFDLKVGICSIERETMSAEGWSKAEANPWDMSVLEMNTAEDIVLTESQYTDEIGSNVSFWPANYESQEMCLMLVMSFGWFSDLTEEEKQKWRDTLNSAQVIHDGAPDTVNGMPNIMYYIASKDAAGMQSVIDLITLWGLTSEISSFVICPVAFIESISTGYYDDLLNITVDKQTMHPKLNRSQFTKICVESPDGNIKRLDPEMFASLRSGDNNAGFIGYLAPGPMPSYAISPRGYGTGINAGADLNMENRVEFNGFPQAPYNIDSFLTYMSNQYQAIHASNNAGQQFKIAAQNSDDYARVGAAYSTIGTFGSTIKGAVKAFTGGGNNPMDDMVNPLASYAQSMQDRAVYDEAQDFRTMTPNDVKSGTVLSYAKPANLADTYIAPQSSSFFAYSGGKAPAFAVYVRKVNDAYALQITTLLRRYGCKSGRVGIPYSANYGNMHFDSWTTVRTSYCKTSMCAINCNNQTAAKYIESMYNSGVTFVDGG